MDLTNEQRVALIKALTESFSTYSALERAVLFGLGQNLRTISGGVSLTHTIFELVRWMEATGRIFDLLRAARQESPENRVLQELEARLFPLPNSDASAPEGAISLTQLHQILIERFSSEELRILCFDIDVDYETLAGANRSSRVRELILYLDRRGRLDDLIRFLRQRYPTIDLPSAKFLQRTPSSKQRRPVAPDPPLNFVDRARELNMISELLRAEDSVRAITLMGTGGMGKTALAAQVATHLDAYFPGGTIWSTLGTAADEGNIVASWGQVVGVDVPRGPDAYQKVLVALNAWEEVQGRLLFVLDDLQSEQLGRTLLSTISAQGKVLITTRDRRISEALSTEVLHIDRLPKEAARYCIVNALGGVRQDQANTIAQLVDLSDGHPLTLTIIANLASRTDDLGGLALRLSQQPDALLGLEDAAPANVTLDTALRLAYKDLNKRQQQRFRRLGVFENLRFDLAAVASVWGESMPATRSALDQMTRRALVSRVNGAYYALPPDLAEFTRSELSRKGEFAETRLRHANHYLKIIQEYDWRAIEGNLPQIRIAWVTALSAGGQLLTAYLNGMGNYFTQRGQWRELREWAQTAHSAFGEDQEDLRLVCISRIAQALLNLANLDEAQSAFKQQHELAVRFANQVAEADALAGLGSIDRIRNQYQQSQRQLERARALLVASGHPPLMGVLVDLALIARVRGDYPGAIRYLQEGLVDARNRGNRLAEATALHFIGVIYRAQGDLVQALPYYQQSLTIAQELGDEQGRAKTLNTIGDIYRDQGRFEDARTYFEQSLAIVRASGSRMQEAESLQNLGRLLQVQGYTNDALDTLDQASKIWQEIGDRAGQTLLLNDSGLTLYGAGRLEEARERFEHALRLARETGNSGDAALALRNLAIVEGDQGNWQAAKRLYEEALAINQGLRDRFGEAAALAGLGRVASHMQEWNRAIELYRQVVSISQETGDRASEAAALVNIGDLLLNEGRFDEAHITYQTVLIIQQLLSDTAGISRTRQQLSRIELLREATLAPLLALTTDAQRFFEEAGFIVTPVDTLNFQCKPVNQLWLGRLPSTLYSEVVIGKPLDYTAVLNVRKQAHKLVPKAGAAFVLIDEGVTNDGLSQISILRGDGFNTLPVPMTIINEHKESSGEGLPASTVLNIKLERYLAQGEDPYNEMQPVYEPLDFYGRDVLALDLIGRLMRGQVVGLFGLRKMGKSSLTRYMQAKMPCPTAWIDLQKDSETLGVLDRILKQWQQSIKLKKGYDELDLSGVHLDPHAPTVSFSRGVTEVLDKFLTIKPDARLAIFLDEIEVIVPRSETSEDLQRYLPLMRMLRGMIQENGRLSVLVSGLDNTVNQRNIWGKEQNPFYLLCDLVYLPPLLRDDLIYMVTNLGLQVGIEYSSEVTSFIADASGGHPLFARKLCSAAYQARGRKPGMINLEEVHKAFTLLVERSDLSGPLFGSTGLWEQAGLATYWGNETARLNQALLIQLAEAEGPVRRKELLDSPDRVARRKALDLLEHLGLVHVHEKEDGDRTYAITFGLMRDWIRLDVLGID